MLDSFTKLVINNQGNLPVKTEYWALVSGGKDSLFMLFAILKNKLPLDRVVTVDFRNGWYNSFDRLGCPNCPFAKNVYKEQLWLSERGYDFIKLW